MQAHPLTDEYGRFGSFDLLAENNRKQMQGLIEELAAKTWFIPEATTLMGQLEAFRARREHFAASSTPLGPAARGR